MPAWRGWRRPGSAPGVPAALPAGSCLTQTWHLRPRLHSGAITQHTAHSRYRVLDACKPRILPLLMLSCSTVNGHSKRGEEGGEGNSLQRRSSVEDASSRARSATHAGVTWACTGTLPSHSMPCSSSNPNKSSFSFFKNRLWTSLATSGPTCTPSPVAAPDPLLHNPQGTALGRPGACACTGTGTPPAASRDSLSTLGSCWVGWLEGGFPSWHDLHVVRRERRKAITLAPLVPSKLPDSCRCHTPSM